MCLKKNLESYEKNSERKNKTLLEFTYTNFIIKSVLSNYRSFQECRECVALASEMSNTIKKFLMQSEVLILLTRCSNKTKTDSILYNEKIVYFSKLF